MNSIFLNSRYDLRSGWKFVVYVLVFVLIFFAAKLLLEGIFSGRQISEVTVVGLQIIALLIPAVVATLFMIRFVDHVPLAAVGVGLHESWIRDVLMGFAIAAGMLLLVLIGTAVLGSLGIAWTGGQISLSIWMFTIGILLISAAAEELVFRGYPMQTLMKGIGAWPAMLIMSILFGLLHRNNPDASLLSTVNTSIAGVMLSLAYLRTRSLWFPYGIHVAWNILIGPVVGFPISGVGFPSLWTAQVTGPERIVGGGYGPEGGFLGTLVFFCGAVAAWGLVKVQVSPQVRATITRNADKLYAADL